jgi:hypothetical protein
MNAMGHDLIVLTRIAVCRSRLAKSNLNPASVLARLANGLLAAKYSMRGTWIVVRSTGMTRIREIKVKDLIPKDLDEKYWRQAALLAIYRVLTRLTYELHGETNPAEMCFLMVAIGDVISRQKEIINDIFFDAAGFWRRRNAR